MPVPLLFPRMLKGRKFDYAYDVRGNQRYRYLSADRSKFWEYTWDGENRLRQAALTLGGQVVRTLSFKYDPFGRRIEKQVSDTASTVTTTYVYDGENIVFTTVNDGTATTTSHYVHGPGIDEPLAMVVNGQSSYYHADGLGSIVALTDAAKNVIQRYGYDSFGMVTAENPEFGNFYAFTGREWDRELGLYYYRARYYDPMEGRFISRDPIGFAGGDVNIYAYVQNQPVDFSDPYGLLNPAKTSVGLINASRGIQSIAKGVGTIAAGTIAIPFTGGISGPTADTIGAAQIALGFANLNRGMQQASEAYSENMDEASWKNLLGLAPFGQKFDDPCEPGPIEYFSGVWDKIVADPYNAAKGAIKDFFAFD
ncbi:RHS repeat domain-containing protein [Desulfuromonas acetexigens]|uniref:RHS repeat domain-containing protein n=1 Tax=Trichloromonas acetexigens TaxID=38815 RepID=UPI001F0D6C57|nr:RHS repeat-associated core domain-containing protein [Desulfuromonas acetexigens]